MTKAHERYLLRSDIRAELAAHSLGNDWWDSFLSWGLIGDDDHLAPCEIGQHAEIRYVRRLTTPRM